LRPGTAIVRALVLITDGGSQACLQKSTLLKDAFCYGYDRLENGYGGLEQKRSWGRASTV
jgi:hypothetical protein